LGDERVLRIYHRLVEEGIVSGNSGRSKLPDDANIIAWAKNCLRDNTDLPRLCERRLGVDPDEPWADILGAAAQEVLGAGNEPKDQG